MRIAIGLIWILALVCFYIGCSTDSPVVGNPAQPPDSFDSLPALPAGNHDVRRTSIVDSDTQPGNAAIEFANATPFAGQLLMTAGEATVGDLAYGMYQFVPRVDPPVMFTIESTYYDADPLQADPGEAFWFGYGDYDRGSWVFSGPHLPSQTRVPIPEGANLQSGGGFVYCVIISIDSTILTLHSVSLSYDAGPGYEETWLAPPAGDAVADASCSAAAASRIARMRLGRLWSRMNPPA